MSEIHILLVLIFLISLAVGILAVDFIDFLVDLMHPEDYFHVPGRDNKVR